MLIGVLLWAVLGIGIFTVGGKGISLVQDRQRAAGRHSLDEDRVKPEDLAKEWQRLRWTAFSAIVFPLIVLSDVVKASEPLRQSARLVVIVATVVVLIWEIRSWHGITDAADRRRALNTARHYFPPAAVQLVLLLHVWEHGLAFDAMVAVMILVMAGPEVESWVRRRLTRRAGGTATG